MSTPARNGNIQIALQKKGRLTDKSIELLTQCGLRFDNYDQKLIARCENFPVELLFLRDDDIPEYVQEGIADLGICGENVILEKAVSVEYLRRLGFSKCSLQVAVPQGADYDGPQWLMGKTIATSYPVLTQRYLDQHDVAAQLVSISGSVEIAPGLGLSDAIVDLVSTGSTLRSNGLRPVAAILQSEAILIANPAAAQHPTVQQLLFRMASVFSARRNKYILLNAPTDRVEEICAILPGVKAPTVMPLAQPGWVALHSVISESDFWEKIQALREAGAEGILVLPIEKLVEEGGA
jgi:ATP phosphoribosyltransferase